MLLITEKTQAKYRVGPIQDDGTSDITFRYHFPTAMFGSKHREVTALALRDFIVPHMLAGIGQGILQALHSPRLVQEFNTMLLMLQTLPDTELDKIHQWIWVDRCEDSPKNGHVRVPVENAPDHVVLMISLKGRNPHVVRRPTGLVPGDIR